MLLEFSPKSSLLIRSVEIGKNLPHSWKDLSIVATKNKDSFFIFCLVQQTSAPEVTDQKGLHLPRDSLQFTAKCQSSFAVHGDYEQFEESVLCWNVITSAAAEKRAPTLILQLTSDIQVTAKTLPLSILTSETGFEKLVAKFGKNFECDSATLLHKNVPAFSDYTWETNMLVHELVVGLHARLDKISTLEVKDVLKGHLLLHQALLHGHDRSMSIGSAGGDYSLQTLSTSLRNDYRAESPPPSSMATSGAGGNRRFLRYPQKYICGSLSPKSNRSGELKPSLFFTFMSS